MNTVINCRSACERCKNKSNGIKVNSIQFSTRVPMDQDEFEYDEFGNFIGGKKREEEDKYGEDREYAPDDQVSHLQQDFEQQSIADTTQTQAVIVLPEHRQLFPSPEDTFGPDVQVVHQERDTQTLDEAIVKEQKKLYYTARSCLKEFPYSDEFMRQVMMMPGRQRTVAFIGALHAGKTSIIDMLVEGAYGEKLEKSRIMDHYLLEKSRKVSVFMKPFTVLLKDPHGRSNAITLIDSPGHLDMASERDAACLLADVVVLVVDAVEGLTMASMECLKRAVSYGKPLILSINKIDRLILELKLPPNDCYLKLKHLIDSVNTFLKNELKVDILFKPELGNVVFGSSLHRWSFSIESFADRMYPGVFDGNHGVLFGDVYYEQDTGLFKRQATGSLRTFVEFILNPIYKAYTTCISYDSTDPKANVDHLPLKKKALRKLDLKPLIVKTMTNTIGWDYDYIFAFDPVVEDNDLNTCAFGLKAAIFEGIFGYLVKIMHGQLKIGQSLNFISDIQSDQRQVTVTRMFVYQGGHRLVPLKEACQGAIVFLSNIPELYTLESPHFVLQSADFPDSQAFLSFSHMQKQNKKAVVCKVGVEPIVPSHLPRLQRAIKMAMLCYGAALEARVEETGEHNLSGPGEFFMDSVMFMIREVFGRVSFGLDEDTLQDQLEVRISDPTVSFCETVTETSTVTCYADTPSQRASVCMLCEPLEMGLAEACEDGLLSHHNTSDPIKLAKLSAILQDKYGWDVLAAKSIIAVGPDPDFGPNILINDILPTLQSPFTDHYMPAIIQAFQWTCREGPLVEGPVRGVKFRLIEFAADSANIPFGQIIPTVRRAAFAAMITATIKLMEPVIRVEIICGSLECREAVFGVLAKRRGHVMADVPLAGSPFYTVTALVPAIDSYGLECDLRIVCQGMATVQSVMDHWQPVPGDPMDTSIKIPPLTAAPAPAMARDFIAKTRRRKGLTEEVKLERFLDEKMMRALSGLNLNT